MKVLDDAMLEAMWAIDDLLQRFEATDSREQAEGLMRAAIERAEDLIARWPESADAQHILGLCWYHYPVHNNHRSVHARLAFERALELESENHNSAYHLGLLLFELEHYPRALTTLSRISLTDLKEADLEWQALKIMELKLCCWLMLEKTAMPALQRFIAAFRDALERHRRDPSLGSWRLPTELRDCAELIYLQGTALDQEPLRTIGRFLLSIGLTGSIWSRKLRHELD